MINQSHLTNSKVFMDLLKTLRGPLGVREPPVENQCYRLYIIQGLSPSSTQTR